MRESRMASLGKRYLSKTWRDTGTKARGRRAGVGVKSSYSGRVIREQRGCGTGNVAAGNRPAAGRTAASALSEVKE